MMVVPPPTEYIKTLKQYAMSDGPSRLRTDVVLKVLILVVLRMLKEEEKK